MNNLKVLLLIFIVIVNQIISQETLQYPVSGNTVKNNCYFNNGCAAPTKKHTGLDVMSSNGFNIYSVASGKIEKIIEYGKNCNSGGTNCDDHGLGNTVIIAHKKKDGGIIYSQYSHLDAFASDLTIGKVIPKGIYLGKMGASGQYCRTYWCNTNCSSSPGCSNTHLHFELKNNPIVGAPDGSPNYGYTPNLAQNYGYSDPYIFLTQTTNSAYQVLPHATGKSFSQNSKLFDWNDIIDVINFRIQVKKANQNGWTAENGFTSSTSTNSEVVINNSTGNLSHFTPSITLEYNTTYYWTVRASNNNNSSFYSPVLSFTTPPQPFCNAPTAISSSNINSNSAKINWALDANNTTNIVVEYKVSGATWPGTVLTLPANYYFTTLSNLQSKTTYVYRLKRVCSGGASSSYSSEYNFTTTSQCSSGPALTATSGTISDGSGNYNYEPNLTCSWIINPSGAAAITINFTQFNTETSYDVVRLKNSAGVTLYTFSGNSIPAPVTIPGNYVKVEFSTDYSVQYSGWSLNYNTILNNGIYKLKHKGTNQCLDVINNSNLPGDNVQQCDDNGTAAQQWVITLEAGGFFKLKHKGTNQCLDVAYNSNDNGANVVQYTDNGNDAQRWKIELQSDGAFKLTHKGTSPAKCLDAVNNGNWCGVDVIQYQDNGNDAQRWYFTYLGQNLKDEEAQTRANLVKENDHQRLEMKISPNPAHDEISIDLNLEDDIPIDLYLYDFSGKIVKSWNSVYPNNGNINLDIPEIQNGVYLLKTSNHLCSKVVISK